MPKSAQNPIIARHWRRARLRRWCWLHQRPGQTVFTYAPDGYSVLSENVQTAYKRGQVLPFAQQTSRVQTGSGLAFCPTDISSSNTTETVYLPTASGPMPVVAVINGEPFAVHADHLNTPRRLTDAQGRPRWQWAFSGFGEQAAQSIARANLPTIKYSLRYPGQVDDGNGLFYNFNRFYDPLAGRYTQADPIGLDGGWNRFAYVGGNALGAVDPEGLQIIIPIPGRRPGRMRDPDFPPGVGPNQSPDPSWPRDIWWPDRRSGQWSCKARADCNDNIPGNCPDDPSKRFSFGGGTANDLGTARNIAKANATSNLQCQPKHVSCKCTGPKGEQYSGGC